MINKILAATDGSLPAERAMAFAVELAMEHDAQLVICTVTNQRMVGRVAEEPDPISEDVTMRGVLSDFGAEVLRRAENEARKKGFENYELCEAYGRNIGATIVKQAEAHEADHVVVGSVGATGLSRLLLGSVAASVIHHAHCPVTVVR